MKRKRTIWSWQTFSVVFCFYTILTLFFVPRLFFTESAKAELVTIFLFALGNYIWSVLTLVVFHLGEKYPVVYPFNLKNLGLHFQFSLALAALFSPLYVVLVIFINNGNISITSIPAFFVINTITNSFMYYTCSLAVHQAIFYSQKFRERETQLKEAELERLKMQLHPHFFFNTLNAISALMYRSPKDADRLIVRLSDMFRIALKKDKADEVTLKEETEFLESFLEIHQTLMGKRLRIEWQIEPETLDAQVPNLILQPLAENAIQHGLAPLERGGKIKICSTKQNGKLILKVYNDGRGFGLGIGSKINGIGLINTQARLENLYNGQHKFTIDESPNGGVMVNIEIPFREQTGN